MLGLSGAAISGYAYLPQIVHLIRERCSAGLSERAFTLWLIASALVTFHAVTIGAVVFMLLGCLQLVSTALIAYYARRYRDLVCPTHKSTGSVRRGSRGEVQRRSYASGPPK